jgi:hypothetical protein
MRSTATSIALLVLLGAAAGAEARSETPQIVVRFRAEGPHALGACPRVPIATGPGFRFSPALSGRLIAWEHFAFPRSELRLCELDPTTGTCPALVVTRAVDPRPALSGDWLVWQDAPDGGDRDIFACEYDPVTQTCPVQRLTGSAADQRDPAIDGHQVVFVDERSGVAQIALSLLPRLDRLRDRTVREGKRLRIRVRARDADRRALVLRATTADGAPLASLGAGFEDEGNDRGVLTWTPGFDQSGRYAITFSAVAAGGLTTRESVWIEVVDAVGGKSDRKR